MCKIGCFSLLPTFHFFLPLKKVQFLHMNAKYFDIYPDQPQRNLSLVLLLTEAKNYAANITSEFMQLYSKNGADASYQD